MIQVPGIDFSVRGSSCIPLRRTAFRHGDDVGLGAAGTVLVT